MKFLDKIKKIFAGGTEDFKPDFELVNLIQNDFSIPSSDTWLALDHNEPLNQTQIMEIVLYIKSNYYLTSNKNNVLDSWRIALSMCDNDKNAIQDRREEALNTLVDELRLGNGIDTLSALWLSDKIYVSNGEEETIITKVNKDDKIEYEAVSAIKNSEVSQEIQNLQDSITYARKKCNLDILVK